MNKISKQAVVVAALSFLSLSCVKQVVEPSPAGETITVRASIPVSKVSVDAAGKTTWVRGDQIGIFLNGEVVQFSLIEGEGTADGVFVSEGELRGKTFDGVAVYPYEASATLDGSQVSVVLDAEPPMVGAVSADGTYVFRNVAALLRIRYTNLPSVAQSVRLTVPAIVSGTFTLEDYRTSVLEFEASGEESTLTVDLSQPRPSGTAWVDIPLPQGTLPSIRAELLDVEGKVLDTHVSTTPKTFTVGSVKPMEPIHIPGERMTVEWIWDKGSLPTFSGSFPAVDDNGNVYVATNEGALYKLDRNGELVWRTALPGVGGRVQTSPSVEKDGSAVYFAGGQDGSGVIYAIAADGSVKWKVEDFPWADTYTTRKFWQSIIGIGDRNLYVPVGTLCTLLTLDKETGERVSYGSGTTDGSRSNVGSPGSGCAIGLSGTVSFMSQAGAYTWKKALLDAPTASHSTYGMFVPWGFRDMWPGWGNVKHDNNGVVATRMPSTGENILISCAQESGGRFDVCCYPASFGLDYSLKQHDNAVTRYHWRHQIGTNSNNASSAALQDQGGIVIGPGNQFVIVPMKYRSGASDPKIGSGGLYSIRISADEGTPAWRVTTPRSLSGAAAVDNNGNVHFADDTYYYIVHPAADGDSYEILARIHLRNLLMASGYMDFPVSAAGTAYTGVWSSVKIAEGGRIYLNVNCSSMRGVTCCFTYPGVTGPDKTSSWPQKGADQYNSCRQQL
ncbi:MAG: PQQ-binding-like beta-propeller repeat protein [Bacteroidales bacterium]|nr:PQQ-binding-like beta-propeller repeat protein [Bacteroidales bacterium]